MWLAGPPPDIPSSGTRADDGPRLVVASGLHQTARMQPDHYYTADRPVAPVTISLEQKAILCKGRIRFGNQAAPKIDADLAVKAASTDFFHDRCPVSGYASYDGANATGGVAWLA
jgi:hypothetical protein